MCERRYLVSEQWYNLRLDAALGISSGAPAYALLVGVVYVRDLAVKFTSYAYYIASRDWARERLMLPMLICVAPDIARGAADATCGSGQTHANSWNGGVDNYQGAPGRTRAIGPYLVEEQSSSAIEQCAQTMPLSCDSGERGKVHINTRMPMSGRLTEQELLMHFYSLEIRLL